MCVAVETMIHIWTGSGLTEDIKYLDFDIIFLEFKSSKGFQVSVQSRYYMFILFLVTNLYFIFLKELWRRSVKYNTAKLFEGVKTVHSFVFHLGILLKCSSILSVIFLGFLFKLNK